MTNLHFFYPFSRLQKRWYAENGYRRVLQVGLPLMMSMTFATVTQFTDRIFLGQYSLDALAASMSASITNFVFMSFFLGLVGYVNVFIAQYIGRQEPERVGAILWQGVWISLFAGVLMVGMIFPGYWIFFLAGHEPAVQAMEREYFAVLCLGSVFPILAMGLGCFYSGQGLTKPIMLVNLLGAAVNIPLDYALINGVWGAPELGIRGAGYATVCAWFFSCLLFTVIIFRKKNETLFKVRSAFALQIKLCKRLLVLGGPCGGQMMLDVVGFTFFVLVVGRIGTSELAASNMVLSLNHLTFLPMIGLSIAVETLVGQAIGSGRPEQGYTATINALHLCLAFGFLVCLIFVLFPEPITLLFKPQYYTLAEYASIAETGKILLWFVAGYTFFNGFAIIYTGALKGAGDTRFVMILSASLSVFALMLPSWVMVVFLKTGIYAAWATMALFVFLYAILSYYRFRAGRWMQLKCI